MPGTDRLKPKFTPADLMKPAIARMRILRLGSASSNELLSGRDMAFRQPKSDHRRESLEWRAWIDKNRVELLSIGLPAEVLLDKARWSDFLQNGHLHWHESSGFSFGQLSSNQLAALCRFLEREYAG